MIFNIFKKKDKKSTSKNDTVLIYLDGVNLSDEVYKKYDTSTLEDMINNVIQKDDLGVYDGNDSGPGVTIVYLYTSNAEKLFSAIKPILSSYPLCKNARVVIGGGIDGSVVREEVIVQK